MDVRKCLGVFQLSVVPYYSPWHDREKKKRFIHKYPVTWQTLASLVGNCEHRLLSRLISLPWVAGPWEPGRDISLDKKKRCPATWLCCVHVQCMLWAWESLRDRERVEKQAPKGKSRGEDIHLFLSEPCLIYVGENVSFPQTRTHREGGRCAPNFGS